MSPELERLEGLYESESAESRKCCFQCRSADAQCFSCHHLTAHLLARSPYEPRTAEAEMGAAHTLDYHDTCPSDEPPSGFSRFSSSFARSGRVLSTEPSTTLMATPQPGVQLSTCPMAVGMVRTALAVPLIRTCRWPLMEHGRLQHTIRAKTTWTSHSHVQVRNFLAGRGCRDSTLQVSLSGYFSFSQMKMVFRAVLRPIQLAISPSITSS